MHILEVRLCCCNNFKMSININPTLLYGYEPEYFFFVVVGGMEQRLGTYPGAASLGSVRVVLGTSCKRRTVLAILLSAI